MVTVLTGRPTLSTTLRVGHRHRYESRAGPTRLQPTSVAVVDESGGRETSFALDVVADCFAGLAPEKREALVATIVADVGVEGLAITARTADEAA